MQDRDGVLRLPGGLAGAHVVPPWSAVVGAAVVVVLALVVTVVGVMRGRPDTEPVATRPTHATTGPAAPRAAVPSTTGTAGAPVLPPSAATAPAAPTTPIVVHVVGEVKRPQVVRLPAGSRVSDAIAAAGGATRKAVLAGINLARPLVDGEQVVVPDKPGAPVPIATLPPPTSGASGGVVDLNTADQTTLETLPGVGEAIARRIIEWRTRHGRFASVDQLGDVSGIGEKTLEKLRPHVRV